MLGGVLNGWISSATNCRLGNYELFRKAGLDHPTLVGAGLPLAVAAVPLTKWPLAPAAYIPADAASTSPGPARDQFKQLQVPPSAAHVLLSARDLFATRRGGAHAPGIDRSRFGLAVSLALPPGSLASVGGGRARGSGGHPVARFLPIRCFPLTDAAARSEAAAVVRSDGTRSHVTLCAVARVGAAACPEIVVHACVRVQNSLSRTLLVRPCRADPRVSTGGHSTEHGQQPCVAIPPGAAAHLPTDCVTLRGVQLAVMHTASGNALARGLAWSSRVRLMLPKTPNATDEPQPARAMAATCGAVLASVRQHMLPAAPGARTALPLVTHVAVRPGVCVINTTPVAMSVAISGADPAEIAVPPFTARGVMFPTTPVFVQLGATLVHSAASDSVTIAPGRPALMHCRHASGQATSTVAASLTRTADAACIVLSANACVLNVSPVPLHAVAARAQHAADSGGGGGGGDAAGVPAPLPLPRRLPGHATVRLSVPTPARSLPRSASSRAVASPDSREPRPTVPARPHSAQRLPSLEGGGAAALDGGASPRTPTASGRGRCRTRDTCGSEPESATASGSAVPALAQLEHLWPHVAPSRPHSAAPSTDADAPPLIAGLADLLPPRKPRRDMLRQPSRSPAAFPADVRLRPPDPADSGTVVDEPPGITLTPAEAAPQLEPVLLSLPPVADTAGAGESAAPPLLHLARLGDGAAVAAAVAEQGGPVLRLQGLRQHTLPLAAHAAASPSARTRTLRVPLQPGAEHQAMLHVSMHDAGAFGDQAADTIAGMEPYHPALPLVASAAPPAVVYITPTHVVTNRMDAHVTLEQPRVGGRGIAPLTHQLLPPGAASMLLTQPRRAAGGPHRGEEAPTPTVRITASERGCKRCATISLTPSLPWPVQLAAVTVPPAATIVHTTPVVPFIRTTSQPSHAPAAALPRITCTALDPFADDCATVHIVNLTAHSLRAFQPVLSAGHPAAQDGRVGSTHKPETMDNVLQDVPPHSRKAFLWDSVLSATIARRMGGMSTDVPPLPSIKLRLEVGVSIEVHVRHAHGWPVGVADWLGTGSMPYRYTLCHKLGSAKVFADGAMAQDARAVAEKLQIDVRRVDVWRLEVVVSEMDVRTCSHPAAPHPRRGLRLRSCMRADVRLAGALVTVVHAERAREVLVATVRGVHACLDLDDEGRMHARASLAAIRATNSHRLALFRVLLASPVVTSRTTQARCSSLLGGFLQPRLCHAARCMLCEEPWLLTSSVSTT